MTDTWRAEDIPAYQIDGRGWRPKTNEDAAMSAPNVLIRDTDRGSALAEMLSHLTANREYAAQYNRGGEYEGAMKALSDGANLVQVGGRGYRIRDIAACDKEHGPYLNCPACLPGEYPVFDRLTP